MNEPELNSDLRVENALLRASLWLTARALKTYHDAPHFEIDDAGVARMELIVQPEAREKAADALDRATKLLEKPEQEKGR